MKDYKYYTVYEIINLVNGKIYIGYHATDNLDDGYMGSGYKIMQAISKYHRDSFHKEILFTYNNKLDAHAKEREIVTEDFIKLRTNYNYKVGGLGGFNKAEREAGRAAWKLKLDTIPEFREKLKTSLGTKQSPELIHRRTHMLKHMVWVHNKSSNISKKCKCTELESLIKEGWTKGRLLSDDARQKMSDSSTVRKKLKLTRNIEELS